MVEDPPGFPSPPHNPKSNLKRLTVEVGQQRGEQEAEEKGDSCLHLEEGLFLRYLAFHIFCQILRQIRHSLQELIIFVFSTENGCPFLQWVFRRFLPETVSPRMRFSLIVTGSKCSGLQHPLFRQRWSNCRPSGIVPTNKTYAAVWVVNCLMFT